MTRQEKLDEIQQRRLFFAANFSKTESGERWQDLPWHKRNSCPSCGYLVLYPRGGWEICSICNWEDDSQDNHDADEIQYGPNYEYSLTEHRLMTADFLADLKDNPMVRSEAAKVAGLELSRLDGLVNQFSIAGKESLLCQFRVTTAAFDALWQSRIREDDEV